MAKFRDYEAIKKALDIAGGVMTVSMFDLRDTNGSGRLGPYVVEAISKNLASKGIGHYPSELPQNQLELVRLYGLGGHVADLYALLNNITEDSDEKLREYGQGNAKEKLDLIRQIVC